MNNKGKLRILAIPDLHIPFEHRDALAFLKWAKKKYSPDVVVNLGDEADMHALSDYDKDPDGFSAGDELIKTKEKLSEYYSLFPETMVCTSNHTSRPFRRALKYGIPKAYLRDYREFLDAPKGWEWHDHWSVDGTRFEHGQGYSGSMGALKAALTNMEPTVIGHIHSHAGIQFAANDKHLVWGMNAGCLIDRHAYAMAYGRHMPSKPILGLGIIDKGVPSFVPMLLDGRGRWVK